MKLEKFPTIRNSKMNYGDIYFWTATINNWNKLLELDSYKDVIIESLEWLSSSGKVDVFGFVIMPTHLHFIWRILELNSKESPQGSFLKYTAHKFRTMLSSSETGLDLYRVNSIRKKHEFWQRDPLAIPLYSREVAFQKLNYIHHNPLGKNWQLVKSPCDYEYSSARYYIHNDDSFPFLKNLYKEF